MRDCPTCNGSGRVDQATNAGTHISYIKGDCYRCNGAGKLKEFCAIMTTAPDHNHDAAEDLYMHAVSERWAMGEVDIQALETELRMLEIIASKSCEEMIKIARMVIKANEESKKYENETESERSNNE